MDGADRQEKENRICNYVRVDDRWLGAGLSATLYVVAALTVPSPEPPTSNGKTKQRWYHFGRYDRCYRTRKINTSNANHSPFRCQPQIMDREIVIHESPFATFVVLACSGTFVVSSSKSILPACSRIRSKLVLLSCFQGFPAILTRCGHSCLLCFRAACSAPGILIYSAKGTTISCGMTIRHGDLLLNASMCIVALTISPDGESSSL